MTAIGPITSPPLVGKQPVNIAGSIINNTNSVTVTVAAPTSGNILLCLVGCAGTGPIASITQTNVAWSELANKHDAANQFVDAWVGKVSGSPGTSVVVTLTGTSSGSVVVSEWAGLAGVLDQSASDTSAWDAYSSPRQIGSGSAVIPSSQGALVIGIVAGWSTTTPVICHGLSAQFNSWWPRVTSALYGFPGRTPVGLSFTGLAGGTYCVLVASIL